MEEVENESSEMDIKNVLSNIKEEQDTSETIDKKELIRFEGKVKYLQIRPVPVINHKKFTCDICKKGVGTKGGLIYHMKAHINGRPFKCDICHRSYATKNDYDTHFKRHAGLSYKCDLCKNSYRVKQYLADHLVEKHFPKIIPCSQCKKHFATKAILKRHIDYIHLKLKTQRLHECKLCGFKGSKKAHEKHCEDREKLKYECVICAKKFPCFKLMIEHRKQEDRAKFCNICQIKVTSIKIHMYNNHKTRICNFCKTFKTDNITLLTSHSEKCKSKEKVALMPGHSCKECKEKFDSILQLTKHLNNAHGKLKCQICFNTFFLKKSLNTHVRYHNMHKHQQISLYRCILCPKPKVFHTKKTFDSHFYNSHSTANRILDGCRRKRGQLVCDKCRGRSRSKDQLLEHISECYNNESSRHDQQRNVNFKPRSCGQVKDSWTKNILCKGKSFDESRTCAPNNESIRHYTENDTEMRHLRNRKVEFTMSD